MPLLTTCPDGGLYTPAVADEVINVVGEHQALQQQTVIEGLAAAGYPSEAAHAHHLSYGMVSRAEGRISGRKGVGISADAALDEAVTVARERIAEKRPELGQDERDEIAEAVGVGSLRHLMAQYSSVKPIVFNMEDVVSFEGSTGLYLQYALVRMRAILRKAASEFGLTEVEIGGGDPGAIGRPGRPGIGVQAHTLSNGYRRRIPYTRSQPGNRIRRESLASEFEPVLS